MQVQCSMHTVGCSLVALAHLRNLKAYKTDAPTHTTHTFPGSTLRLSIPHRQPPDLTSRGGWGGGEGVREEGGVGRGGGREGGGGEGGRRG